MSPEGSRLNWRRTVLPTILPCGDAALAVEFGDVIDPRLNARVLALDARLAGHPGVVETVPTYRSLLVHYDPLATDFAGLSGAVLALAEDLPDEPREGRIWRVPVVYGGSFGVDLEDVARQHGLDPEELVRRHSAPTYRVYMIGFVPGYTYLGGLDPTIATPRREVPRTKVPAGTISIGGIQAVVASIEAPSGWHLLGRTPARTFMPGREPAFLMAPGDRVRFAPIPEADWDRLDRAAAAGEIVAEVAG
jgi:KipI family sensor histidine kinase inhibitor